MGGDPDAGVLRGPFFSRGDLERLSHSKDDYVAKVAESILAKEGREILRKNPVGGRMSYWNCCR